MKVKVFAIWDDAAKAYMQPFQRQTTGLALRDFGELVNDTNTIVGKHPEQFTLFQLATFDDATGIFGADHELVLTALQVKQTPTINAQQELIK